MAAPKRIILGSGKVFAMEFTGTLPEDTVIETVDNRLGHVKNGATLEYAPEFYNAKDDLGEVQKSRLVNEDVKLKTGIMTLDGNNIAKLSATARVTEASGKRTVKIGGAGNDNGKKYVIRFLHEDEEDGAIRVTIVGRNESGFSLAFAKDAETVVDAEFTAVPNDSEGTLVIYEEETSEE